ncbi:MAG TPA: branched-chain amino acid ABC transporter permease [Candidatus Eisenbacteria bacterium]|nr:branched-chain amino acid ABC transporter permease [Candidatus Eisenbacteria bacterium]
MKRLSKLVREQSKNPNAIAYAAMAVAGLTFPGIAQFATGGNADYLVSLAADAGVFVLLAIGLNVVVGFAGLLDLGYAAFFAIGSYTYGMLASQQLISSPLHTALHVPFWIALVLGMFIAAGAGALLGAPTLRLRGDYLAIVTLGFGEIVPRFFRNMREWTSGVNGISALDVPTLPFWITGPWANTELAIEQNFRFVTFNATAWYVLIVILIVASVIGVNNLHGSRLGRAWMAVREDETAAAAMGVNTVNTKLLAFAIGASFSGFAGAFYGAKLSLVSPESFGFVVSITILSMVVLGGMGNIPGAMVGALLLYAVLYKFLPDAPLQAASLAHSLGLDWLNTVVPDGWPGLGEFVSRLKFIIFGLILVTIMLVRPQGLLPSRLRAQELKRGVHDEPVTTLP